MAKWFSSHSPLLFIGGPGFHQFRSWMWTYHHSSGHAEESSHRAQAEGPTARIYNCVLGGLWGEEEEKDWQQMLAQVPIFKKKKAK